MGIIASSSGRLRDLHPGQSNSPTIPGWGVMIQARHGQETLNLAWGTLLQRKGTLSLVSRTFPFVSSTLTLVAGAFPFVVGALPFVSSAFPFALGAFPLVARTLPLVSSTLPLVVWTLFPVSRALLALLICILVFLRGSRGASLSLLKALYQAPGRLGAFPEPERTYLGQEKSLENGIGAFPVSPLRPRCVAWKLVATHLGP